nr:integrase, catalytic region, zinc finger, CCHC-type, peptidase aspartic, catalytic [Tanacetum cinerariifolium]
MMANLSEDIRCACSDTRPPMLDRSDFESWQQRIRLYCLGKDNGENILKSIDEGPFKMGKFKETLAEGGQTNTFDDDVDEAPVQDLALNEDNTMFMVNLSSADPIYDDAGPSYDSDILSENIELTEHVTALQEQNERFMAENKKVKQHYKAKTIEKTTTLLTENEKLKAQLKGKMQCVTRPVVKPKVLSPGMYAIDVEPILPRNRNNTEVHLDYLKHLKKSVETLHEIVEEARIKKPLDNALENACFYTKRSQE